MAKKIQPQDEPKRITLDELTFEVKIRPDMDRELVKKLIDRIAGKDEDFMKKIRNYLGSNLTYGICGKGDVLIVDPNVSRTL